MAQAVLGVLIQVAEKLQHLYNELIMKIYYAIKFILFTTLTGLGMLIELSLSQFVKLIHPIVRWIRW